MKYLLLFSIAFILLKQRSCTASDDKSQHVKGYTRKDGTEVKAYDRRRG